MQTRKEEQLDIFNSFKDDFGYMIPVRDEVLADVERVIELWTESNKLSNAIISMNMPTEKEKYFKSIEKLNNVDDEAEIIARRIGHRIVQLIKECPF